MSNAELEAMERELEEILKKNHEAFVGKYAAEINELLGLSKEEIDKIVPGTTDLEVYDRLMIVVKESSRRNESQATLKGRIETLGEVAVTIAKKTAQLAKLFL